MYFNFKSCLDDQKIDYIKTESIIKGTFPYPDNKNIINQIDYISTKLLNNSKLRPKLGSILVDRLHKEIIRDIEAIILSVISSITKIKDWNVPYEKISIPTLYPSNILYENEIETLTKQIIISLSSKINCNRNITNFLSIQLTISLNNEVCQKENEFNTRIKKALTPTNPAKIISDILPSDINDTERKAITDRLLFYFNNIVDKTIKNCSRLFKSTNQSLLQEIKKEMAKELITSTSKLLADSQQDIKTVKDAENAKVLIPHIKTPAVLDITADSLHNLIQEDIDNIYKLWFYPYISLMSEKMIKDIEEFDIIETPEDLMKYPEMFNLYQLSQTMQLNLHTLIHDVTLNNISVAEQVIKRIDEHLQK